jgi:hydrogenase large subunit
MAKRITIDPVTRIEGHLRIDVEVDGGAVSKAWACCTMWRGIENILRGRDSREAWLFAQRFCGVCTTVHAIASVRSVEDSLGLEIPANAQYIRNLILIAHGLHDHIVHFYHLSALDWIDVTLIPKADVAKASSIGESLSSWPGNSKDQLKAVQNKVKGLLASQQLGIFGHGYWGHPALKLPPEVNLLLFSHYLQALEAQRKINQVVGVLGGKTPHIQNLAVGGVMNAINLDSLATMNMDRLYLLKSLFDESLPFVYDVYFPDALALANAYPEWFRYGSGVTNYLASPDLPVDPGATRFELPGGVIMDGSTASVKPIANWKDEAFRKAVAEDVTHAWYEGSKPAQPWSGSTDPKYTSWDGNQKYTWVKAPRYDGRPMQVGPLSQILAGYGQNHALTKKWVDQALTKLPGIGIGQFQSTMGRILARAIRSAMLSDLAVKHWELLANNILKGDEATFVPPDFPLKEVQGVGIHEAPRGTLSHWTVVEQGVIKNYQAVVPTTWNASPRDEKGQPGPYEMSLLHNPVAQPDKPLEVLRTVHSFDPCMACACHTYRPGGEPIATVKVL